jgi:hypothetical protein
VHAGAPVAFFAGAFTVAAAGFFAVAAFLAAGFSDFFGIDLGRRLFPMALL